MAPSLAAAAAAVDAATARVLAAVGLKSELQLLAAMALVMVALALPTIAALVSGIRAPYGKYYSEAGRAYGPLMNGKLAWVLQELPSLLLGVGAWALGLAAGPAPRRALLAGLSPQAVLLALYAFHYTNRALIYPLRLRGGKPTPLVVFLMALAFCLWNGWMQGRFLAAHAEFAAPTRAGASALLEPRFAAGVLLWATGLGVNWQADAILRGLRKPGETGYKIPRGGAFELVSGANFFGEILEWAGFALAAYQPLPAGFADGTWLAPLARLPVLSALLHPAVAFAVFTFANIAPRGAQHHAWYLEKFRGEYPRHRKAVIPFLW